MQVYKALIVLRSWINWKSSPLKGTCCHLRLTIAARRDSLCSQRLWLFAPLSLLAYLVKLHTHTHTHTHTETQHHTLRSHFCVPSFPRMLTATHTQFHVWGHADTAKQGLLSDADLYQALVQRPCELRHCGSQPLTHPNSDPHSVMVYHWL